VIDDAVACGSVNGVPVNGDFDYYMAAQLHQTPYSTFYESVENLLQPSMKMFYENLGLIHRGEFWVFSPEEIGSLEDYEAHMVARDADFEYVYYSYLANMMFYDLLNELDGAKLDSFRNNVAFMKTEHGIAMPAERFLEYYASFELRRNGRDSSRVARRGLKASTYNYLRSAWHK